jgi:hypothetical protein
MTASNRSQEETAMTQTADRDFDWVAALAYVSGIAVVVASLAALAISMIAVVSIVF